MKLYSLFQKAKTHTSVDHINVYTVAGGGREDQEKGVNKMSGSAENRSIGRWLAEKDSGNESEPELSTWDFSQLNISPKPLHSRPLRSQTKPSAHDTHIATSLFNPAETEQHKLSFQPEAQVGGDLAAVAGKEGTVSGKEGFTRCLRSRVRQISSKVNISSASAVPKSTSTLLSTETNNKQTNNNYIAQCPSPSKPVAHYSHCDHLIKATDTILAMALTQVVRKPARSRPFDAASLYSVTSDDFNESDDELISINGDSNSDYTTNSVKSPRLSSKRKRTTTLSADLEVESLLSPSVDDSVSSGDNFSVSDFSETEELMSCEIPRKRLCSAAPSADNRPYLDLEKMQDKVEKSASLTMKRRPRAIRIMCFSPIKNRPTTRSHTNRELVMSTRFCPLTPVESYPADCYS